MERYKTVKREATAEQIIERSRFIAHIRPVESREEADAFIEEIRSRYRDATHNVPAMVIGDKQQIQWGSDDGEPQGTSGAPMVQLIVGEGLTNLVIVVTRYFGGIKLGTGGLVRAYSGSARQAIEAAGICSVCDVLSLRCRVDYSSFERIRKMAAEDLGAADAFVIEDTGYEAMVTLSLVTQEENGESLKKMLTNLTSGGLEILEEKPALRSVGQEG